MDMGYLLLQTLTQKSHLMFSNATCISPPPLLLSFLENNWTPVSFAQDTLLVPRRILSLRSFTLARLILLTEVSTFQFFQNGDSGSYLASLAAQLSQEMGTSYHSVLQQLEDLRLAEWSDQAPPPPSHPGHRPSHTTVQNSSHTYANYPSTSTATSMSTTREEERRSGHHQQTYGDSNDPIYQPGQYAVRNQHFYVFLCIPHKPSQPTCCLLVFTIPS